MAVSGPLHKGLQTQQIIYFSYVFLTYLTRADDNVPFIAACQEKVFLSMVSFFKPLCWFLTC